MKYLGVDSGLVLSILWALWIWQLMSLTSGKLFYEWYLPFLCVCVCWDGVLDAQAWEWGESVSHYVYKKEPPSVGLRTVISRSKCILGGTHCMCLDRSGSWMSCSHSCAVRSALFCSHSPWTLCLHCIVSYRLLSLAGLTGILPTIPHTSLPLLSKSGLSYTKLTNKHDSKEGKCGHLPFSYKSISCHYYFFPVSELCE